MHPAKCRLHYSFHQHFFLFLKKRETVRGKKKKKNLICHYLGSLSLAYSYSSRIRIPLTEYLCLQKISCTCLKDVLLFNNKHLECRMHQLLGGTSVDAEGIGLNPYRTPMGSSCTQLLAICQLASPFFQTHVHLPAGSCLPMLTFTHTWNLTIQRRVKVMNSLCKLPLCVSVYPTLAKHRL